MNIARLADESLRRFGEYPSFHAGGWHTNAEMLGRARRFAGVLRDQGVGPGGGVAVLLPNSLEVFEVSGGTLAAGGTLVPVLFLLAAPEIRHILADARPRVLVTGPLFLDKVLEAIAGLPDPPRLVVVGEPVPDGAAAYEALMTEAEPIADIADRDDDDIAVVMYTGGTTGHPKGVMLSHRNLHWNAVTVADAVSLTRETMSLLCLPVAHLFGLFASIIGQVIGLRGVLLEWFTPDGALAAIEEHRIAYTAMVPAMLTMLLQHPDADRHDTSSLEMVFVSAAPVPEELAEAFERRFDCQVLEAYGQTEAAPAIALNPPGAPRKAGSAGPPLPGVEVRIEDGHHRPLPPGERGEIVARSPGIMRGYRGLEEETGRALAHGWLHTGDAGYLDREGYLFVTDRVKDLVIRGGENVYPGEVEAVLLEHPGVSDAAVVGRPDDRLGEEIVGFVVKQHGVELSEQELIAHCRERLAGFKCPREVRFLGALPLSPIGKVLKRELRDLLAR